MDKKNKQLSLIKNEKEDKTKYYVAFSYLFVRPLFKSKLFEYFDYDIKKAFYVSKNDLKQIASIYNINVPRDFIQKRDEINVEECY